jgi:hypothetical protein
MIMSHPVRKFAGTIGLLLLLIVYALLIMVFATSTLPSQGGILTTLFYVVAGVGWVPVAMLIVSWMYKRDKFTPRA